MMKDTKILQEGVSMVKCEICGKELKNTQGLNGHKRFAHGQATSNKPAGAAIEQSASELELTPGNNQPISEQQLSELERRLQKLERVTGLRSPDLRELLSGTDPPLTNQIASITQQLSKQAEQLSKLSEDVELARVSKTIVNAQKENYNNLLAVVNSNGEQLKQAIDAFNGKLATTERNFLETKQRLDKVEAQQLKDRDEAKSIHQTVNSLKADMNDIRLLMLRKPADSVATLRLTDGRDHKFREYKGPQGLRRPHKTTTDWILGDKFIDLSEPED
jgi:DNA repair exonuclease SbcCD ATPase subunit